MTLELLLIGGVLVGSLSPLLTFARLFQMKEWRLDRLTEHLRREGWMIHLIGRMRGALLLLYILFLTYAFVAVASTGGGGPGLAAFVFFIRLISYWVWAFAAVSIGQVLLRKQRVPVWTSKAMLIVTTALVLTTVVSSAAFTSTFGPYVFLVPLVCFAQPVFVFVAWLLWKPVDVVLKQRILRRASAHRATFSDPIVIGIVGSVGKTTTKELLHCLLEDFHPITTPEHVNTEMGVAQWLLKQARDTSHETRENSKLEARGSKLFIIEMGAYREGEIATLCEVAKPNVGVVTALGSDHLALFGSEEAIVDANAELLEALPKNGKLFLLGDSDAARKLAKKSPCPVTIAGAADATTINESDRGLSFESQNERFTVALHGRHNAGNALLAIAIARSLGVKDSRIRELLAKFRGTAHTFHLKKERGVIILDDTYNVSPLSFAAALDWAAKRLERPRVLLTSGLLETGPEEERFLKELGEKAKKNVNRVVFTTSRGSKAFKEGYGKEVEILDKNSEPVAQDGLLLCVGRMPQASIQQLLP